MKPDDPVSPLVDAIAARVVERLRPLMESGTIGVRPRLLTIEQAAIYLCRTPKAMYALKSRGAVPVVRTDGRVMFDVRDLDLWIEQNKEEPLPR
jgi:hypothetical protein